MEGPHFSEGKEKGRGSGEEGKLREGLSREERGSENCDGVGKNN